MEQNNALELQCFQTPVKQPLTPPTYTSSFSTIRQGNITNDLTKIRPRESNTSVDFITGAATTTQGNFAITFPDLDGLQGLKTSTYKLLDAITVALTESGAKSAKVTLPLDEYMSKCGLKDRKEARKQAGADLETLFNARVTYKEKARKRGRKAGTEEPDFYDMRICEAKGIRNGIISFSFGESFFNLLKGYPVMPYPPQLWRLSSKCNPNSFYFLRKISEHKNMNVGKKNEDTIAVKTLLAAAPYMPSYDEVMSSDRALNRRIVEPFERDMDELAETLTWEYCHINGAPLTDEEASGMDYNIFSGLNVHVFWKEYPDQAARLEAKAERQAAKRNASKKKKADDATKHDGEA